MADICMCHNAGSCPKSDTCFRALATPDEYQTVANFYHEGEDCDHYWPCESAQELHRLNKMWKD